MKVSTDEESLFQDLLLNKIKMSYKTDAINYSLQFVEDIRDCVLVALGINLVLETKDILEQDFLKDLEEKKLYSEFANLIENKDKTVKIEFEKEIGYENFFLFMCRFCYFNLRDLRKAEVQVEFLDALYEKMEN